MATILVTNLGDLDQDQNVIFGTLRWAVGQANATEEGDTIVFDNNLFRDASRINFFQPQTITLDPRTNGDQLTITSPLSVLGPGPGMLTIAQSKTNRRIFEFNVGSDEEIFDVEISGVTLSGGNLVSFDEEGRGGAIFNREALTMVEVVLRNNRAGGGGGAVYTQRGSLSIDRSLIMNNFGGVGGAIMNGSDDEEANAVTTVSNSTLTGNSATGVPDSDTYAGPWGGAIFNRQGRLFVQSSTITGNSAAAGGGIASFGNPLPEDPDDPEAMAPPPVVFTYVGGSIVWRNNSTDVDRVGTEGEGEEEMELMPSFFAPNADPSMPPMPGSLGFNIVGTGNAAAAGDDFAFTGQVFGLNEKVFVLDGGMNPFLANNAGPTLSFLLDPTGIAVDKGGPAFDAVFGNDQRGRFFVRNFDYKGGGNRPDVGAVELQQAIFVVDVLRDEEDQQYSGMQITPTSIGTIDYDSGGDFSLREALAFSSNNPELDAIVFSSALREQEPPSAVLNNPTIRLTYGLDNDFSGQPAAPSDGQLVIRDNVIIFGPAEFTLEIDASGNDATPNTNEGNGSRVFLIDDGDAANAVDVSISNLTIMGGDIVGRGGGIFNRETLTLTNVTVKENNATDDGGGLFVQAGNSFIFDSTFNNNRAADDGGALFVDTLAGNPATDVTIENATFSANIAGDRGGAIHNNNAKVHLNHSTLTLNTASSTRGSGVWNAAGASTLTEIKSSIISANSSNNDVEFATGATTTIVSKGYNLVGGGNASPANPATGRFTATGDLTRIFNPMLGPLLNTGGATATHRPLSSSPAIDAGDPAAVGAPQFDQRGPDFVRIFDGNLDGTARIDIGAYELQKSVFIVSTDADENDGNVTQGFLSLREAIQLANDNPLPDEITFDPMLVGLDVVWGLGGSFAPNTTADMQIRADVKITGPRSDQLTLDLSGLTDPASGAGRRAFTIDDLSAATNINVEISGLTFRNGLAEQAGGVMLTRENLTLTDVVLSNNTTIGDGFHGGAIYAEKPAGGPLNREITLTIDGSLLTGNHTDGVNSDGGAIYARDVAVFINNYTTISGNSTAKSSSDGGGIFLKSTIAAAPANFDLDTDVDGGDFLAWQRGFGLGVAGKIDGDATGDGANNVLDFNVWKGSFGSVGNQGGILNVANSSISGNLTGAGASDGAGVFSDAGEMLFTDAVISGNRTTGSNSEGGGIAAINGQIALVRSVVSENETFGSQSPGAGVYVLKTAAGTSTLTIDDSIVANNIAHGQLSSGGGVATQEATVLVRGSTIDSNSTTGSEGHGGGIANLGGTVLVVGSTVSRNRAVHATGRGGGIYSDTNLAGTRFTQILNSTVSSNVAAYAGGGVYNADGLTDIKHSTLANNSTPLFNRGSGVASFGSSATLTRLTHSIVAGNQGVSAGTHSDINFVDGAFVNSIQSAGFNLIGVTNAGASFGAASGDQVIGIANPFLGALQDNSAGLPAGKFSYQETHALLTNSPAKNAGNAAFNPNSFSPALSFDNRGAGYARVLLGRIDVGAFEASAFPTEPAIVAGVAPSAMAALAVDFDEASPAAADQAAAPASTLATTAGLPEAVFSRLAGLTRRALVAAPPESEPATPSRRPLFTTLDSRRLADLLALADEQADAGADQSPEDAELSAADAAFALLASDIA